MPPRPPGSANPETVNHLLKFVPHFIDIELETTALKLVGSFKNYEDKVRWVCGQKMPIFVNFQGKKIHAEVGILLGK